MAIGSPETSLTTSSALSGLADTVVTQIVLNTAHTRSADGGSSINSFAQLIAALCGIPVRLNLVLAISIAIAYLALSLRLYRH